jgi:N,N-dimethylformamidase beta subunit-like, C-terminal/Concanavalin A-like lectin/glucanases superfamily
MEELLGYADALSVEAGTRLGVRVSSSAPDYEIETLRLLHGDASPDGPGVRERAVDIPVLHRRPARRQMTCAGSYVAVPHTDPFAALAAVTVQLWVRPTRPAAGARQALIGNRRGDEGEGFELALTGEGDLELKVGGAVTVRGPRLARGWWFVAGTFDGSNARLAWQAPEAHELAFSAAEAGSLWGECPAGPVLMAAASSADGGPPRAHFDGRISGPTIVARALDAPELEALAAGADPLELDARATLATWDFGRDFAGPHVHDRSRHGHHGIAHNLPTRAVTGPRWTGAETRFTLAPHEYAAIHFHRDDLEDAGWDLSFELDLPDELPSAVYTARLRTGAQVEDVPFVVRPPIGRPTADVLLLLPTFTYLAYANERLLSADFDYSGLTERAIEPDPLDAVLARHPELGLSLYDLHADGSGVCHSSALRPILSLNPRYRMWLTGAPRHFSADLYAVDWLDAKGFAHDVATDGCLHEHGRALLDSYPVVITGSHPEYVTGERRAALAAYVEGGGRCLYLGGNGFYWVTSVDPERPHLIEVRRGHAASRCWESEPGECHHSTTGELGGIWRHRGRPPNALVGVGFIAQGSAPRSPGYVRCPDSHDPRAAFIFEGVGPDEVIGDFGLVMGGAAGDELDCVDPGLGTPPETLLLATSRGRHDDGYLLVHEEQLISDLRIGGSTNAKVGADMTYLETESGGAVFSVGSIAWTGSLSHAGYDNNVSRITENVLRGFLADRSRPEDRACG